MGLVRYYKTTVDRDSPIQVRVHPGSSAAQAEEQNTTTSQVWSSSHMGGAVLPRKTLPDSSK